MLDLLRPFEFVGGGGDVVYFVIRSVICFLPLPTSNSQLLNVLMHTADDRPAVRTPLRMISLKSLTE